MTFRLNAILATTAVAFSLAAHAQAPQAAAAAPMQAGAAAAPSATDFTEGEVRKVDKDAKKVTIRHGAIKNLEMPPMTMVFAVTDPAFLERVKAGDKVRFKAVDIGGKLTVTELQAASAVGAASKSTAVALQAPAPAAAAATDATAEATATVPAGAPVAESAAAAVGFTEGDVRKVDKGAKKITLKHNAIKNLDMPAMTMVFAVKDDAFLSKVKAGDKVQFKAIDDGGKLTVVEIQEAK